MLMMLISWTTGIPVYPREETRLCRDFRLEASKHAIPNHNALPFHKTAEGQYPYPFEKELGCMTILALLETVSWNTSSPADVWL